MRHNRFIIPLVWVACLLSWFSVREGFVARVLARDKTSTTIAAKPRDAQPNDLKVGIFVDRDGYRTSDKPRRAAVIAYVVNVSAAPISVWPPGLVGPIFSSNGPIEGVPLEIRSQTTSQGRVILQTNEMVGRAFVSDDFADRTRQSAYYTIYASGHEGEGDQISALVHSDGRISKIMEPHK